MDYSTLKIIHLTSLAMTFMGLTGVLVSRAAGAASENLLKKRRVFRVTHGLGLLILLGSGLALASTLGVMHPAPGWLKAKLGIWLLAGGGVALANRCSRYLEPVLAFFTLLVLAAAWLAIRKPF